MRKSFSVTFCLLLVASLIAYAQTGKKAASDQAKKPPAAGSDPFAPDPDPFGGEPVGAADPFGGAPKKKDNQPAAERDPFGGNPFGADAADRDPFGPAPKKRAPGQPQVKRQPKANRHPPAAPPLSFPVTWLHDADARERFEKILAEEATFDYVETPLSKVVEDISYQHDLQIQIDVRSLEEFGIDTITPITISVKGVSLRSALRLTLRPLELTHMVRDEVLMITTPEEAESRLSTAFYHVGELLPEDGESDWLIRLITGLAAPDTWDNVGGPAVLDYIDHLEVLVVSQTYEVHVELRNLLGTISKLSTKESTKEK